MITNEVTGERVLTAYKLSRENAALAFHSAKPDLTTREVRILPDPGADPWSSTRCGEPWADTKPGD